MFCESTVTQSSASDAFKIAWVRRSASQTAETITLALSSLDNIGHVSTTKQVSSVTSRAASWVYVVRFISIVGDVGELVVVSGKWCDCGQVRTGYVLERIHAGTNVSALACANDRIVEKLQKR